MRKKIVCNDKKQNEFEFKIDGLEDLKILEVTRPSFELKDSSVAIGTFSAIFRDTSNPSCPHALMKWLAEQFVGASDENYVPRSAVLRVFDSARNVVEEWEYSKIRLLSIDFNCYGELSTVRYSDNLAVSIKCSVEAYTLK